MQKFLELVVAIALILGIGIPAHIDDNIIYNGKTYHVVVDIEEVVVSIETVTPTFTDTPTQVVTETPTNTQVITSTFTPSPTNTVFTPTKSLTPSMTPTRTPSNTFTPSNTRTPTRTSTITPTPGTPTTTPTTALKFQDEFTTVLNPVWFKCPIWYNCNSGGGTDQQVGAQAWFYGSQVSNADGNMQLIAEKLLEPKYGTGEHAYAHPYKSGYAITGGSTLDRNYPKLWFTYGYFEAKMKCPAMRGAWCAFWLWSDPNGSYEIDITETLGNAPNVHNMNLHGVSGVNFSRTYTMPTPNYEWHVYAVDWQPGYIKWYVDGVLTGTYTGTGYNNRSMYLLLTYQLGGTWAGSVDESKLPNAMLVDYVNVWNVKP